MYILLQNPGGGNTVLLQLEPGTVVNVYNNDPPNAPSADAGAVAAAADAAAAAGRPASVFTAADDFAGQANKIIYNIKVNDAAPTPADIAMLQPVGSAALQIPALGLTVEIKRPSGALDNAVTYGGKKRRYHGKTKKSRR
jgi:hypothetical protein